MLELPIASASASASASAFDGKCEKRRLVQESRDEVGQEALIFVAWPRAVWRGRRLRRRGAGNMKEG
jgi:hypothetical protein